MQFRIGSYTHGAAEAVFTTTKTPLLTASGSQYGWDEQWAISGKLFADTPVALATAVAAMELAYAVNYQDVALLDDSGNVLRFLRGRTPLGGTQVTGGVQFPESGEKDAEFSTWRTYTITVKGTYPVSGHLQSGYLAYQETIQFQGTGGPKTVHLPALIGPPQKQIVQQQTVRRAVQRGSAVGIYAYPPYPGPIWPADELLDQREQTPGAPKRSGLALVEWPIEWAYYFESAGPLLGLPHTYPVS